jgi:hypothetical protein
VNGRAGGRGGETRVHGNEWVVIDLAPGAAGDGPCSVCHIAVVLKHLEAAHPAATYCTLNDPLIPLNLNYRYLFINLKQI